MKHDDGGDREEASQRESLWERGVASFRASVPADVLLLPRRMFIADNYPWRQLDLRPEIREWCEHHCPGRWTPLFIGREGYPRMTNQKDDFTVSCYLMTLGILYPPENMGARGIQFQRKADRVLFTLRWL